MHIYLDSADLSEIESAQEFFPIDGVTTNPTILARTGAADPIERLQQIRLALGPDQLLFAQLTDTTIDGGIKEIELLKEKLGEPLCIKVPVTKDNFPLMKAVKKARLYLCATACYTVPQAIMAAKAGADFVAPYISHIDNIPMDGPELAIRMQEALYLQGYATEVLGASFRTEVQVEKLMAGGVAAVTVTRGMLDMLSSSFGTDNEVRAFEENWFKAYDNRKLTDFGK